MSNYDEFDFIADAGEVKDGVDSATDILDTSVENIEPVHIESKSTQKRVDMRNNTHSFSVNSFYLIVF